MGMEFEIDSLEEMCDLMCNNKLPRKGKKGTQKKMIEILIRMTEKQYEELNEMPLVTLHSIIRNGQILPKGHGRVIDANKLLETWYDDFCEFMTRTELESMNNIIKNAQTIIEADKEGAEE